MIHVTDHSFDPGAELAAFCAGRADTGAVASFVGLARGQHSGELALVLDAYPGFTETRIGEMAAEATRRFSLDEVSIIHRFGAIATGEPIVLVLTAARHRRAAFEACEFLMDHLKSDAPIWKREGKAWIEPTTADRASLKRWETA